MQGFTEVIKQAFELYAQGKTKNALSMLPPGSQHYDFIKMIDAVKNDEPSLKDSTKKLIKDYKQRYCYYSSDGMFDAVLSKLVRIEEYDFIKTLSDSFGLYFNHEKPYYAQNTGQKNAENLGPNKWNQTEHYQDSREVDKVYSNDYAIQSLHRSLWNEVDYTKLSENAVETVIITLESFAVITKESFVKRIGSIISERYKNQNYGYYYSIPSHYLTKMTLEQMDKLAEYCPKAETDSNFVHIKFQKKYHYYFEDPEFYECASLEDKRAFFVRISEECKKEGQGLKTCVIRQILEYGIKLDIYDENLFVEYLKYPISSSYLKYNGPYSSQGDGWTYTFSNLRLSPGFDDHSFYRKLLYHFYHQNSDWKSFSNYFDPDWIKRLRVEYDFLDGKEIPEADAASINASMLSKQVLIEFTDANRNYFKVDERVKVVVDLKNVPTLYIKVFEFNSLNYFKKTQSQFKTDVNLDGLIATKEFVHEFSESPQKKFRQTFEFEHLDDRVGVFIIELIGNGFSSRATIKKGALSLIHKSTIAGQVAYIVDENRQICASEDTGIWYNNVYFKSDVNNGGRILIPYEKYRSSGQAVLVHNGFAHLEYFNRLAEEYLFDVSFVLHPESIVMGNEATVLIRPKLELNGRKCSFKLLENCTATLTTVSFVDNIPIIKSFENLEVNERNEVTVEFQVPSNLQSVNVTFSCSVRNISKGVSEQFIRSKYYNLSTNTSNAKYYEAHLRRYKGSYHYYALGKNGEPLNNVSVNFTFNHSVHTNVYISSSLYTDKDGRVDLGPLDEITQVTSNFVSAYGNCSRSWNIPYLKEQHEYPSSIEVLEEEPIEIPVPCLKLSPSDLTLFKMCSSHQNTIEDCYKHFSLNAKSGHGFGTLTINSLTRGNYTFEIRRLDIKISIIVHKGVYWEADGFVLKDNSIIEIKNQPHYLRVHDAQFIEGEESKEASKKSSLYFKLSEIDESTRAHVYAFTYMPNMALEGFNCMSSITKSNTQTEVFPFSRWDNIFQSNRKMGDEYRYVFNRKNAKRFIGNTLERPQLIMKRLKVRDTNFDSEVLKSGSEYQGILADKSYAAKRCADMNYMYRQQNLVLENSIYSFQNFLKYAAVSHKNLHPSEDGSVCIDLDLQNYTSVIIVATNSSSSTQIIVDNPHASNDIEKRDLTGESLDPNKYFTEVRNEVCVMKNCSLSIQDITSTEYIFVDSISKAKRACDDICKIRSVTIDESLSFLVKWNSLSLSDKHKKYNEFQCHEMNLFLYFKDYDYFVSVAKPFISSKMEKTFIDYWLLGDYEAISQFQTACNFDKLNCLEQCLLVSVALQNDVKTAQALASRIKLSSDSYTNSVSVEVKNRMFDTVLSLNSLQKNTEKIELMKQVQENVQRDFYRKSEMCQEQAEFEDCDECYDDLMDIKCMAAPEMEYEEKCCEREMSPMRMAKRSMVAMKESVGFMNDDNLLEQRNQVKTQFQELENASEYCETHYFKNTNMRVPNLISANKFWDDFAHHILKEGKPHGFVSENFIYATNSTTELIMMLAVIDLPFDEPTHRIGIEGNKGIKVDTAGNMAVFKKEIKEAEADLDTNLLSIHRFYEYSNPNSKKKLKEFLTHQVYTCEVVVTNVSTDQQNFQTLWQIPEGSIPVSNTNYQKTETKQLGPYSTLTFKFHFYFPRTGKFVQFPTNITMNEKVVATAKTCYFNVVDELSEITFEMFSDYIQSGNFDKICEFLQTANLIEREKGFAFYDILWLLKDKDKFYRVYEILRSRFIYDNDVWSYGFNYSDTEVMNEYMQRNVINVSNYNTYFYQDLNRPSGELISKCTCDDLLTLCLGFRHLDYYPLINARAHQLADEENQGILNREFRETYNRFLFDLAGKKALDTEDKLNWTLYYLLQDKTTEAIDMFAQVDASTIEDQGSMRVQFDYLAAYLDFFTGIETNFKTAREVSAKYAEYPVLYWKGLFTEIAEQLQEYDCDLNLGDIVDQANELLKKDNLKVSKNLEPLLECRLDRKDIVIDYLNIDKLDVKYYVIDPELMFSKSPFISQNTDEFSYIKPLKVSVVELSKDLKSKTVAIDPEFASKNLIIELVGGGKQVFLSYFSTDMRVIANENFGELKVIDEKGNSQPKVYVKVYAKHNSGEVKFFRDGYTDIRGKIEYAQSSSGKLGTIEKFSVFIMSDELGSMTKECKPPSNVKKDRY